jgi:hypothetical protein
MITPSELLGSNRTRPCTRQVFGVSGSGKTYFLNRMLSEASRDKEFGPLHRFIIIDIKHDGYEDLVEEIDGTASDAIERIQENRISVVHADIEYAQEDIDVLIDYLFATAQRVPEFSATLVIEESSSFITPTTVPNSIKRLATQGRSLGLSLILANQRALSNKWTDTQSTSLTCFRLAIPDRKLLKDRWGLDAEVLDERLSKLKFSFAHYDLEDLSLRFFSPVPPKPPVKKKKSSGGTYRQKFKSFVKM